MKYFKMLFITVAVLTLCISAGAQSRFAGTVVEVINGRTVVIDTDGRKLMAEVEFIEVPEPEQPLHKTVREHLEKLVLGKTVEFRPHGIAAGRAVGQLYVNSVDIALQMLRDGAAWQIPANMSGQKEGESSAYQYHQNQAKLEQRGVWGVKDMKPAWQFRAEKYDTVRQARIASEYVGEAERDGDFSKVVLDKPARRNSPWSDVNPYLKNPGPLVHGYNAASKTGYIGTTLLGIKHLEDTSLDPNLAWDITYVYKQESDKSRTGKYIVTLLASTDNALFLKDKTIKVLVDDKTIMVGKPKRTTQNDQGRVIEKLTWEISRNAVEKIVYGGEVIVKVGELAIYPGSGTQLLLYNMLQVSD